MSKMVAGEAIRNVAENLAAIIEDPQNIEAMGKVAFGSYQWRKMQGLHWESTS